VGLSLCLYISSYYLTGRVGANSISITLSPSKVGIEHILCINVDPLHPTNVRMYNPGPSTQ
jgi:hypothetical protein